MTNKERLQIEVERLTEDEAARVVAFIEQQFSSREDSPWPPLFAGIVHSGGHDLGARSEEILRAELGAE